jgi:hypothetical protein
MTKKKNDDFGFDLNGDDVNIEFGPIKIKGTKGPTKTEVRLKDKLQEVIIQNQKIKNSYLRIREKVIRQEERLSFYRQLVRVLLPKLENMKNIPDDKKKEEIEKIRSWIENLTKDDNLEEK